MNENSSNLQETSGNVTASRSDRYRESTVLISDKINQAFNKQIGHELGNSLQYLAIATHFESESLFGLAKIYYKQADEDREHAMKFRQVRARRRRQGRHSRDRRAPRASLNQARGRAAGCSTPRWTQPGKSTTWLPWRPTRRTTSPLNFLQWFVSEQLEEVSSAETRLTVIRRAGPSMLMVEAYLAHETK